MTTQTRVLPDLDETLDFSPTCDWNVDGPCTRTATWIAESVCGCTRRLLCDGHHDRVVRELVSTTWTTRCFKCGMPAADADIVVWWPL